MTKPIDERDAHMQVWVAQAVQDCGEQVVHDVLALQVVFDAKTKVTQPQPDSPGPENVGCRKLVVIVHGIRDQGTWMDMLEAELRTLPGIQVQITDFDYYDAFCFMCGIRTAKIIDEVRDKILVAEDEFHPKEIDIIAHSFGTYVVTEILRKTSILRVNRLIFCGAVVSRSFQYNLLPHAPKVINECGGRDIWPIVAQGFRFIAAGPYGAAGVFGLRQAKVTNRYHDFGHSAYLTQSFVRKFWLPYVNDETWVESPYQTLRRTIPYGISYLAGYGWWMVFFWIAVVAGYPYLLPHIPDQYLWIAPYLPYIVYGLCATFWIYVLLCIGVYLWSRPKAATATP